MKMRALTSLLFMVFALGACQKATFKSVDKEKSGKPPTQESGESQPGVPQGGTDTSGIDSNDGMLPSTKTLEVSLPVDSLKFGKETTTATAVLKGSSEKPKVTWTVTAPNGKDPGTIDPKTGVYTSPDKGNENYPVTIIATLDDDPSVTGSKPLPLKTGKPELIVTVPVAEIKIGEEKTTATAKIKDDPAVPVVTWTVSGPAGKDIGSIDPKTGVYTSPKTGSEKFQVEITATLDSDPSVKGSTPLIVVPAGMMTKELIVTVKDPEIKFGETTTATAAIKGGRITQDVTWTVSAPSGKAAGSIDSTGKYTAPATGSDQYPVTVTAVLKSDPSVKGSATITLKPANLKLEVVVESPEVKFGGNKDKATAKLNGVVIDASKVTWSVSAAAGRPAGSIDANGVYTSPNAGSERYPVTITAVLVADNNVKASAAITLIPGDSVFARCTKANTVFPILAEVYQLPEETQMLPTNWAAQKHVTTVCMDKYAVADREFTQGFPEVPNLFEWFALHTKTTLVVPAAGVYTIRLNADDGAKLWIGGQLIIDNDGLHEQRAKDVKVQFPQAGNYNLVLDYYQGPRYRIALELFWKKPGDANFVIVPKENFK